MKKNKIMLCLIMLFVGVLFYGATAQSAEAATYTVKPATKPCEKTYQTQKTYNEKTRQYYTLRSYLEKLEQEGGGTLILKKGTYAITNTLFVPSNTTIILSKGVVLKKTSATGTKKLVADSVLFSLADPSQVQLAVSEWEKIEKERQKQEELAQEAAGQDLTVQDPEGQEGQPQDIQDPAEGGSAEQNNLVQTTFAKASNVTIQGKGTPVIDMNKREGNTGIFAGNSQNVTITGISFQNNKSGQYIVLGGSTDVSINGNLFVKGRQKTGSGILLETLDAYNSFVNYPWCEQNHIGNTNVSIMSNVFKNMEYGVKSAAFTKGVLQKQITVSENEFRNLTKAAVQILNWELPVIQSNTIIGLDPELSGSYGIYGGGVVNPSITQNTITKVYSPITFEPYQNSGTMMEYGKVYNTLSSEDTAKFLDNTVDEVHEYWATYHQAYQNPSILTDRWFYYDITEKEFTITPTTEPYRNFFTYLGTYTTSNKGFYLLHSYLTQLEQSGGGVLRLQKGTYPITLQLFIPSNVTLILEDGAVLKKIGSTPKTMFQLVKPSKGHSSSVYGGYEGETNIQVIGEGTTATLDLNYMSGAIGIAMGHNTNITIQNINFTNVNGGHFLEIAGSQNVLVENCSFKGHMDSTYNTKEAIGIDVPNKVTKGFTFVWTKYDNTPNDTIIVQNNVFEDVERAIGSHKYTQDVYHTNIQFLHNTVRRTDQSPILMMNWKNAVVKYNDISTVVNGHKDNYGVYLKGGVKNPTITENVIDGVEWVIYGKSWKNNDAGAEYDITFNKISDAKIKEMYNNTLGLSIQRHAIAFNTSKKKTSTVYQVIYPFPGFEYELEEPPVEEPPVEEPGLDDGGTVDGGQSEPVNGDQAVDGGQSTTVDDGQIQAVA